MVQSWPLLKSKPTSVSPLPSHKHTLLSLSIDANGGIDDIVEAQRPFALKHQVSFGDL